MTNIDTSADHSSYYILNREYFSECFDQSANTATSLKTYRQAILFIIVASIFYMMEIEPYVVWFLICLSVVELLSIRYKRSWWVARQMLSRAAGSKVNIRIDDQGIFTDSIYHQQAMLWSDIAEINNTEKGFVVIYNTGTRYLSRRGIEENTLALLDAKAKR
ncbi:MAG: hypothetical protein ACJA0N_001691 [Pseudohongiellaceae bacterium]|jgi:hypothetical protein